MKIINEKGKLFGIINIIDLSILLIIGLIIVGAFMRMRTKPIIANETTEGIITFEIADIRMVSIENMIVGEPMYFYDKGTYIGEIIDVSYEPYKEVVEFEGKWISAEVPEKYVALLKVKSNVKDSPDVVIAGGEQIRVGALMRLKNKSVTFFGTVLGVEVN